MFYQDIPGWSTMGKTVFEPLYEMQKLTGPVYEGMMRENISLFSDNMSTFIKYMQGVNKSARPEDFIRNQMNLAAEQAERNLQYGQNVLKLCEDSLRDYHQWADDKITPIFKEQQRNSEKESRNSDKTTKRNNS